MNALPPVFRLSALLAAALVLGGCSVAAALQRPPDLTVLKVGAGRAQVEAQLGPPVSRALTRPGVVVDIYEYRFNENPSILRALGNSLKGIVTLGISEWTAESARSEITVVERLQVTYDDQDQVTEIRQLDTFGDRLYREQKK